VTPSFLKYLKNGQVCFKVYGYPDFEISRKVMKKEMEESKNESLKKENDSLKYSMKIQQEMVKSDIKEISKIEGDYIIGYTDVKK